MAYTIAVAGKGGSGKTTLASLLVYHLIKERRVPILAVDADPNANFNIGLGLKFDETVADLREEVLKEPPAGMSRTDFLNMRLQEAIVEGKGIDLLVMGKPEGPGCYCAANHLLREYLNKISSNYRYAVIDNEAGLEHLSRRTTNDVDVLFLVGEPSLVSLRACLQAYQTARSISLEIKDIFLVINKDSLNTLTPEAKRELDQARLTLIGRIPFDKYILEAGERGEDLLSLPDSSQALNAVKDIMEKVRIL
jgi:CO dehydrogenase maturation factor